MTGELLGNLNGQKDARLMLNETILLNDVLLLAYHF